MAWAKRLIFFALLPSFLVRECLTMMLSPAIHALTGYCSPNLRQHAVLRGTLASLPKAARRGSNHALLSHLPLLAVALLVALTAGGSLARAEEIAAKTPSPPQAAIQVEASPIPPLRFLTALDLTGQIHRIGNGEGYEAVALVFMNDECPISREYVPELNRLAKSLADKPVKFLGVIGERGMTRARAAKFQEEFKIEFPVLFDASGELRAALQPTHVPEAFVLDKTAQVVYHGRIDDQYAAPGKKRPQAMTHDLSDAVTAVLAGNAPAVASTTPVGCPMPKEVASADQPPVTYNREIAPIMLAHCAECHRPGEVAPCSLLTFEDAAKRAEHLADVTGERRMPP